MDIKLNETTWDVEIENGDLVILDKSFAIQQHVRQRLWIFEGEYFLDQSEGVPWFRSILKKNPDLFAVDALLKDRVLNTPGVLELIEFELDYDASARKLFATQFRVRALDGVVDFGSLDLNVSSTEAGE
jgi:hypothetical protein